MMYYCKTVKLIAYASWLINMIVCIYTMIVLMPDCGKVILTITVQVYVMWKLESHYECCVGIPFLWYVTVKY